MKRPSPSSSRTAPRPPGAVRGFTLIELMVTLAIAGIMATLAAPAMTSLIKANRIQTEAASLVGDMQFARAEAIKRGNNVTLCPSDGTNCLATDTWHAGWMIYNDLGTVGTYDVTIDGAVLRKRAALLAGDTAVAGTGSGGTTAPANMYITFNREGFASGGGAGTTMVKFNTSDSNLKAERCISVDLTGRLTTLTNGNVSMQVSC